MEREHEECLKELMAMSTIFVCENEDNIVDSLFDTFREFYRHLPGRWCYLRFVAVDTVYNRNGMIETSHLAIIR